jgi:putative peptide zinc metalloprotease protein
MTLAAAVSDSEIPLGMLRTDLKLLPAAPDARGIPGWTVYDPLRNRYFRIGPLEFECLSRWRVGTVAKLVEAVRRDTVLTLDEADVEALQKFLMANFLLVRPDEAATDSFARIARAGRRSFWKTAVHGYLFFRVPLVRPTRFLRATQPIADTVAHPVSQAMILLLGVIGLFLVGRQWDQFTTTFLAFLNWEGALWTALTLTATKVLHELGHAYTVTRRGGRVPTMGVAFLVLYPVLYTDTSDAWRLTSRKARLAIATAGIRVELAIALLATFLWSFLPDGPLRSAVFLLATATWVTTLFINLNPFMRFDGYYILSDWLEEPNLQDRAFALTRWWMRERLFGFGEPPPEQHDPGRRAFLIAYSFATWIYRFFLFLGIALLVYHLFFKVAGIILFVVEILWFILFPITREVREWGRMRDKVRPTLNLFVTVSVVGGALFLFFLPLRMEVTAPALLQARDTTTLVTATSGRLVSVTDRDGHAVEAGHVVAVLESPDLEAALASNAARLESVNLRREQSALRDDVRGDGARLDEQFRSLEFERMRIKAVMDRLTVTAPSDGVLLDLPPHLAPGLWLGRDTPIGRVVSQDTWVVAYVDQADLTRLDEGSVARFLPEDPALPAEDGIVSGIDGLGAERLAAPHFSSLYGGEISTRRDKARNVLAPLSSVYRVDVVLDRPVPIDRPIRGTLRIEASPMSAAERLWRVVGSILIRESGF